MVARRRLNFLIAWRNWVLLRKNVGRCLFCEGGLSESGVLREILVIFTRARLRKFSAIVLVSVSIVIFDQFFWEFSRLIIP